MKKTEINKKIVIAGPGAGKTYDMVEAVLNACRNMSSNKYCIVITYTNSATGEIKRRLQKKISIPSNLFIGTIHSFLNRFFILPFASPLLDVAQNKVFLQTNNDTFGGKGGSFSERAIKKKRAIEKLNRDGKITYDETVNLAEKIINIKKLKVVDIISNRIEYLFVDEFQDACNKQVKIFGQLIKSPKIQCYIVGDPEQYIWWWDNKGISNFLNIPFFKVIKSTKIALEINHINRRSSKEIVEFLNNFSNREYPLKGHFYQNSFIEKCSSVPVYFLSPTDPNNLLEEFKKTVEKHALASGEKRILAKNKDMVEVFSGLARLENTKKKNTLYASWEEIITTSFQKSVSEILKEINITKIQFRKLVFQAINRYDRDKDLKTILKEEFGMAVSGPINKSDIKKLDKNLIKKEDEKEYKFANIHQYKGLESDSILLIAKTCKELKLWIETDQKKRDAKQSKEKGKKVELDVVRVGYVGFSRAKKLLCIGCLDNIDKETKQKLIHFQVAIV